jgi:zinc transport system permease protein
VLIALICPILGIFLIVRRYTLISDTLAHSSLTGVIIGLVSGYSPVLTTLIYSMISSFVIERFRLTKRLSGDMVLALFLSLNMAFVAIALSLNSRVMLNIGSYLF